MNKITFRRTRSLSNAACFKHDNNVCACAVSALILLPVVSHWKWIRRHRFPISFTVRFCVSSILVIFHCARAVLTILLLPVKILRPISIQHTRFHRATACNATHGIAVVILSVRLSVCQTRIS